MCGARAFRAAHRIDDRGLVDGWSGGVFSVVVRCTGLYSLQPMPHTCEQHFCPASSIQQLSGALSGLPALSVRQIYSPIEPLHRSLQTDGLTDGSRAYGSTATMIMTTVRGAACSSVLVLMLSQA